MNTLRTCLIVLAIPAMGWGQTDMDQVLTKLTAGDVPFMSVQELKMKRHNGKDLLLLDTREPAEYEVSRIPGAELVGFSDFSTRDFTAKHPDKSGVVVVYCSIGVRSEKIARKLKRKGYKNVRNLYGGIFRWKNNDYELVDKRGEPTDRVHAYSKRWGRLLRAGEKVYQTE